MPEPAGRAFSGLLGRVPETARPPPMARRSDTQRRLLERAIAHEGLVVPPPGTARENRAAETALRHGLLGETRTMPGDQFERRCDEEGVSFGLVITAAGRRAIGEPRRPVRAKRSAAHEAPRRQIADKLIEGFTARDGAPAREH